MVPSRYLHLIKSDWIWSNAVPVFGHGRDSGGDNQLQSVPEQEKVYQEFVKHYGLHDQGFFGDPDRRSTRTENRAELQRLLNHIYKHFPKIDNLLARERLKEPRAVIIVWRFDRLSRDPGYAAYIRADMALRAIVVLELSEAPLTGNGLADDLIFIVKRSGDRQQLEKLSGDAKRGQAFNLAARDTDLDFRNFNPNWPTSDGRYLGIADGKVPVGYRGEQVRIGTKRRDRKDGKGTEVTPRIVQRLIPDDNKWTRCYQAWLMRRDGRTLKEIHNATRLYKSYKGYSHFFANRIYAGDYEHGGVIYEDFVPRLIPRNWFEDEQARRRERGKKRKGEALAPEMEPRRISSPNLLSGKLFCETVPGEQHPMHAHRSPATKHRTKWNAYECSVRKHSHGDDCPFYGVSQEAVDKSVVEIILRDVITRDTLRPLMEGLNSQFASHQSAYKTQLDQLKAQIAEAEKQREKYQRLIKNDDDPSPTLVSDLKGYEAQKATLLEHKRQLEARSPTSANAKPITDAQLDEYIARVRDVLLGADEALAKRILDHFVDHVSLQKGSTTGTLYYTFPSDFFSPDLSPLQVPSLEGFRVRVIYRSR